MKLTRRSALTMMVGALATPAIRTNAQTNGASGTITVAAYSSAFQDLYTKAVIEPFMVQNPNVNVTYYPIQNSAQLLGLLRAQRGNPEIDVAILDVTLAKVGSDEGIFAPLDVNTIPSIAELHDTATIPGVNGRVVTFDHVAMIYNTEEADPPPTAWADMWDPKYSGRVVVQAPPDTMGILLTIIANHVAGGDSDYTKLFQRGIERMAELAPSIQTWDPRPDPYPLVINGTAAIGLGWNARSQIFSDESQGRMRAILPSEGTAAQLNVINTIVGSRNNAAAEAFVNYALGAEAQAALANEMLYAPSNKTATLSPAVLERTSAGSVDKLIPIDWIALADVRASLTEEWRRKVL